MDEQPRWRQLVQSSWLWLFTAVLTLGLTLIFSFNLVSPSDINVTLNQPAPEDVFAPRSVTYESEVLLARAREQARAAVPEQYAREGNDIGRNQLNLAASIFAFIDVVRADTQASRETQLNYLKAINNLTIEDQVGLDLLNLSSEDYEEAKREVIRIVGELMRDDIREQDIREYQITARREASLELTPTQENVVTNIAPQFIVPTVFPDPEATEQLREEAVAAVEPFPVTIAKDERVVRAGERITESDIEELRQLGLLQQETDWRDVASIFIASLLGVVLITMYWHQFYQPLQRQNGRNLTALAVQILLFALGAKLMFSGNISLIYLFPMVSLSMLVTVVFDVRLAMIVTVVLAALIGFVRPNSLELAIYTAAGGLLSIMTLRDAQRINAFFRAGLIGAVGYTVVILIFRLNQDIVDIVPLFQLILYAVINGLLSAALTLAGLFALGSLFGVTTTLQLQELSRLDHPLLQELLRRAPGTYHHSIMVANLAEQAAEHIKVNSTLIRVGAFYHDIGKMNRPPFFTENQEGINPHDTLDPQTSARIILNHVPDGLELAKQYRLPDRIREFIAEHHGTRIVKGFYLKAKEMAEEGEEVDKEQFRYTGPRPRSRESGIVMLADVVESTSRALQPNSEKAIEKLVNSLIDEDLTEGQLENSGLTLGDISRIRASFIKTLKGRFHVRVKYPGNEELQLESDRPEVEAIPDADETAVPDTDLITANQDRPVVPQTAVETPAEEPADAVKETEGNRG